MTNNDFVSPNFQIPLPNLAVKCCWFICFKHSKWIPHRGVMFSLVDKWIFFNAVKALTSSFPNDFFGFFSELIKCSLVKLHYFSNLLQIPWNCCDVNIDSLDRLNFGDGSFLLTSSFETPKDRFLFFSSFELHVCYETLKNQQHIVKWFLCSIFG